LCYVTLIIDYCLHTFIWKHFIQMINKNEYFTWHLVGMNFVLHYFYGFCVILRFFWLYFLYFQYFFGFSSNFIIFITFFCNFSSCYKQHNWKSFVLYISTVILYFVLLKSVNIISINSIKITRIKCRLFFENFTLHLTLKFKRRRNISLVGSVHLWYTMGNLNNNYRSRHIRFLLVHAITSITIGVSGGML